MFSSKNLSGILILSRAGLKARYRNSLAGHLWVVLSPLSTFAAQAIIFQWILKINMDNYLLFLMLGLLPWFFLVQSVEMSASSLQFGGRIVKAGIARPFSLVAAKVLENAVNYLSAFVIGAVSLLYLLPEVDLFRVILLNLLSVIPIVIFTLALSFLVSILNMMFYDTKFIMTFALGIAFYLTPIIYPRELVPAEFQWMISMNPLSYLFSPFREVTRGTSDNLWFSLLSSYLVAVVTAILTYAFWERKKNEVCSRF